MRTSRCLTFWSSELDFTSRLSFSWLIAVSLCNASLTVAWVTKVKARRINVGYFVDETKTERGRDRDRERQRQRQREKDRDRQRETYSDRERHIVTGKDRST